MCKNSRRSLNYQRLNTLIVAAGNGYFKFISDFVASDAEIGSFYFKNTLQTNLSFGNGYCPGCKNFLGNPMNGEAAGSTDLIGAVFCEI